jgi:lysophospholipase L1-like esterase
MDRTQLANRHSTRLQGSTLKSCRQFLWGGMLLLLAACGGGAPDDSGPESEPELLGKERAIAVATTGWTLCATEHEQCTFTGDRDVRYGTDKVSVVMGLSNGTQCSNSVFGDPAWGIHKKCWVATDPSQTGGRTGWQTTWGRSMLAQKPATLTDLTIRSPVRSSVGGGAIKVRLSNLYGKTPLNVTEVHAALRDTQSSDASAIVTSTDTVITFNGQREVSVPAGTELVSDAVVMKVPPLTDLMVSMYFASTELSDVHTGNAGGLKTQLVKNNAVSSATFDRHGKSDHDGWYGLAAVEVRNPVNLTKGASPSVIALGDSITDGALTSSPYTDWPSMMAAKTKGTVAVVNAGIGSNQFISDGTGLAGLTRFNREVLDRPDVVNTPYLFLLEGINDIQGSHKKSAADIIAGYKQLIAKARAKNFKVYAGTLPPWHGWKDFSAAGEEQRQALNKWIRTSGAFDGVIDYETALLDPKSSPPKMKTSCLGDGIHPNANGYKVMAAVAAHTVFGTPVSPGEDRCE